MTVEHVAGEDVVADSLRTQERVFSVDLVDRPGDHLPVVYETDAVTVRISWW